VLEFIRQNCIKITYKSFSSYEVRDPDDAYLLALANATSADYLLSGDSDLLVLKRHNRTKIISYSKFIAKHKSFLWRLERFFRRLFQG